MSPIGIVAVHQTRNGGNIIDDECLVEGIHGILDSGFRPESITVYVKNAAGPRRRLSAAERLRRPRINN